MVFRRLRSIFGREPEAPRDERVSRPILAREELARIGTEGDPLRHYEAGLERNTEAQSAEHSGDVERAIRLYETSVAERFVGAHPYERLAALHEQKGRYADALRVTEAFVTLARGGTMPRGSQRSAERKLPEFEERTARYQRALDGGS